MNENIFHRWGLSETPTDAEVLKAYRRRVQKMHPDRVGQSAQTQEAFCQLQDEYEKIRTAQARAAYRSSLAPKQNDVPPPDPPPPPPTPSFSVFVPSSDITLSVGVDLRDIWQGGARLVEYRFAMPCGCARLSKCSLCRGSGQVFFRRRAQISFAPGSADGGELLFPGLGHQGSHSQGDLRIRLRWKKTNGWEYQDGTPPSVWKTVLISQRLKQNGGWVYVRLPDHRIHRGFLAPSGASIASVPLGVALPSSPLSIWLMCQPSRVGVLMQSWLKMDWLFDQTLQRVLSFFKIRS